MANISQTNTLYASSYANILDVGTSQFQIKENTTTNLAKPIFNGASYSGTFNLSSVVDIGVNFNDGLLVNRVDTSYGGYTKLYVVNDSTVYRYFYSPRKVNPITSAGYFSNPVHKYIYAGTPYFDNYLNPNGTSSQRYSYAIGRATSGLEVKYVCKPTWILYFIDDYGSINFLYMNGNYNEYSNVKNAKTITRFSVTNNEESFITDTYSKDVFKSIECNTGFLTQDETAALERVFNSPDYCLAKLEGTEITEIHQVILKDSKIQTNYSRSNKTHNVKFTFDVAKSFNIKC